MADVLGDSVDAVTFDAPSSRTPPPSLHAASVSVANVIAAAASMRLRVVRADMADPPGVERVLMQAARPGAGSGVL